MSVGGGGRASRDRRARGGSDRRVAGAGFDLRAQMQLLRLLTPRASCRAGRYVILVLAIAVVLFAIFGAIGEVGSAVGIAVGMLLGSAVGSALRLALSTLKEKLFG